MNPYEVLDIAEDASIEEIRRAYKKQALRWHPDKNENKSLAEERFKLVATAYHMLSSEAKREEFRRGRFGFTGSASSHVDPNEIFNVFFARNFRADGPVFFDDNIFSRPRVTKSLTVPVSIRDFFKGGSKRFSARGRPIVVNIPVFVADGEKVRIDDLICEFKHDFGDAYVLDKSDRIRHVAPASFCEMLLGVQTYKFVHPNGESLSCRLLPFGFIRPTIIKGMGKSGGPLLVVSSCIPLNTLKTWVEAIRAGVILLAFIFVSINPQFLLIFMLLKPLLGI